MSDHLGARSLTAKLAMLLTFVVTATVVAMTLQSANKFSAYILQNIEETSTAMAERTSAEVAGIIEGWLGQMSVTISKLPASNKDSSKNDSDLSAGLRVDKDLWAVNLFIIETGKVTLVRQAFQKTNTLAESPANDARIESLKKVMRDVADEASQNPNLLRDERIVRNISPQLKTPSILMAIKFSIPNQDQKFALMTLVGDMTKIQVALPQSRTTTSYIVDYRGAIFASTDGEKMSSNVPIQGNTLVKKALLRQSPSGFLSSFTDRANKQKIGSFAQTTGRLPFYVIIERDRAAVFQIITRTYATSALWGVLIILLAGMASYLSAGSITKNLRELVAATKRIASGDFGVRLQPASRDEVATLGHSVNNMASRIQTLMSTEVEKARFEKELETARMVQSTFFPKTDVSKPHLSVTGSYQPATECGGDLWGHYTVRENVELIFIADAMGHGAPAALVTAIAYAVCQSVSTMLQENAPIDPSPAILLKRLNKIIYDAVAGKISMTFFAAIFDFNTGKITFANAGHNFPFILSPDKSDPRLSRSAKNMGHPTGAITLTLQGNPLGVEPESEFKEKSIDLKAGDKLVFFTDGLIENSLKGHEPLGRKLLIETACQLGLENIDIVRQHIQEKGASIFGTQNLSDDVTIVVAEINKTWQKLTPPVPTQIPLPSAPMSVNSMTPGGLPLPLALNTESYITPNPTRIESITISEQTPSLDQPVPIGSFVLELGNPDDKTEDKTDEKNKEKTNVDLPLFSLTLPTG